nr:MAG TPA: hypothetical protein [Caudoviricetes sp.]
MYLRLTVTDGCLFFYTIMLFFFDLSDKTRKNYNLGDGKMEYMYKFFVIIAI